MLYKINFTALIFILHRVQPGYDSSIIPLDKTLVYVGMITSWLFWIIVFTWYYFWNNKSLLDSSHLTLHRTGTSKSDTTTATEDLTKRIILSINDFGEQHQQPQLQAQPLQAQPVQQAQFTIIPQPQIPVQQLQHHPQIQQVQLGQLQPHLPQPHFIQAR